MMAAGVLALDKITHGVSMILTFLDEKRVIPVVETVLTGGW